MCTHTIQDVEGAMVGRSQPREEVYQIMMSSGRVQTGLSKEEPIPKSDQAAGDHEYPQG